MQRPLVKLPRQPIFVSRSLAQVTDDNDPDKVHDKDLLADADFAAQLG
jgi:hypothetical protein